MGSDVRPGHVEGLDEAAEVAGDVAARVDPPHRLPLVADGAHPVVAALLLLLHLLRPAAAQNNPMIGTQARTERRERKEEEGSYSPTCIVEHRQHWTAMKSVAMWVVG